MWAANEQAQWPSPPSTAPNFPFLFSSDQKGPQLRLDAQEILEVFPGVCTMIARWDGDSSNILLRR
jgi:hypothetical protein